MKLAWNLVQNGKTVRFPWKLYKTLFSGHAQHVLAKSHFGRQSSQKRHTGLKFSPKRENSALFIKLYKTLFSGHAQHVLAKSHFGRQSSQKRHTGLKFSPKRENSALFIKIVQNALFRSCAARFVQIAFWASKFLKSSHWPEILSEKGKQCAFYKNCTKRSFQVVRSTLWPNRIFEHESCQNRHTGLKFSPKKENRALLIKIVQNALFRSCAARFGQIAFLSVKVLKIVKLASNSLKNGRRVRFPWKLYKRLFSGHAQQVLAKSQFWAWKFLKSSHWSEILSKQGKQCAFYKNCTKRSFQVIRSTFWPNRIFERESSQNRHTGLKFSSKREKSALSMKTVQNTLFRSCAARFGQIAFLASKFSKSSHWPEILSQKGKQCTFNKNCTKRSFQVVRSTFWPNRIFEHESSQNRHTGLKFSSKPESSALSMKIVQNALFRSCAARFGQIAFLSIRVLKIVTLVWNSLQTGKTVRFL